MENQLKENELVILIEKSPLELTTKEALKEQFGDYADQVAVWKSRASGYKVTDVTQKDLMSECKIARLSVKNIRVDIEKTRVRLKADSLEKGKAIDNIAKFLKAEIEPLEEYLQEQEDFEKNMIAQRMAELKESRNAKINAIEGVNSSFYNVEAMSEAVFNDLLVSLKQEAENRKIAEEKAKYDEFHAEMEAERDWREQLAENEKLKKEKASAELEAANARAEAHNAQIKANTERAKIEAEKRKVEQKLEEAKTNVATLKQTVVQQKAEVKEAVFNTASLEKQMEKLVAAKGLFATNTDPRKLLELFIQTESIKSNVPIGDEVILSLWKKWVRNEFHKL